VVELTDDERATLRQFTSGGSTKARKIKRALILLAADSEMSDTDIAASVNVGTSTVYRVKRAFVEEGLEKSLEEEPRPGGKRKLSDHEEALLVATTCSLPPLGRSRWTLELLAGEMVRLTDHSSISSETVRLRRCTRAMATRQGYRSPHFHGFRRVYA
jgi:transposase